MDGEPFDVARAYYQTVQEEEAQRLLARTRAESKPAAGIVRSRTDCQSVPHCTASPASATELRPSARSPGARIAAEENRIGPSIVTWAKPDPRIEGVRFLDGNGQPVAGIEEQSDLVIEVSYFASVEVHDPVFAMTIYLADGTQVCHANTALSGLALGARSAVAARSASNTGRSSAATANTC